MEQTVKTLDESVLANLETLGGRALVTEVLAAAIAGMEDQIAAIHRSADVGDADGVARAAHGLKSTAGAVGAARLLEAATSIEASAVRGVLDPAGDDIAGLTGEFEAFRREVPTAGTSA